MPRPRPRRRPSSGVAPCSCKYFRNQARQTLSQGDRLRGPYEALCGRSFPPAQLAPCSCKSCGPMGLKIGNARPSARGTNAPRFEDRIRGDVRRDWRGTTSVLGGAEISASDSGVGTGTRRASVRGSAARLPLPQERQPRSCLRSSSSVPIPQQRSASFPSCNVDTCRWQTMPLRNACWRPTSSRRVRIRRDGGHGGADLRGRDLLRGPGGQSQLGQCPR